MLSTHLSSYLTRPTPLWVGLLCAAAISGCALAPSPTSGPLEVPRYSFEIIDAYPHDPGAYTQGLVYEDGFLYEGTGLYGESSLREVELETGAVIRTVDLDEEYFGEGIALLSDRIIQLTLKSGTGFVYDAVSLEELERFDFTPEGWGLTHDGRRLIMSDGTSSLRFLDPRSFEETAHITVTDQGVPVPWLNELEWVEGEVFANVWQSDEIARISPETGEVLGWIDLSGLREHGSFAGVLNGIAYDPENKRLFVTGKNWPTLFEIELNQESN